MMTRNNIYGTMEEDAFRRDFTINALFYTTQDFSVIDYTQGIHDLKQGIVRIIGDPETRYREDPVRILRAIRFISKLNFTLAPETEKPIKSLGTLLTQIPSARLFHETIKIFHGGYALPCFQQLRHYQLLGLLLPSVKALIDEKRSFVL